ncbi:MAG: fibronectin type III domain-containing protein [Acidimicrobiales bacterium]
MSTAAAVPTRRPPRRRPRLAALALAAAGLGSGVMAAAPASAEIGPQATTTWGVYGLDTSTETDAIATQVFAIEQIGNRIYVGGKFLEARPDANGTPVAQPYLAAFDATSGAFIPEFNPQIESAVYALQASPDGGRLFVAGEFRSVNGDRNAQGLAALDPVTGAVDTSWQAKVSNASGARPFVKSLTVSGDQLYLSGRFDRVGGGRQAIHTTEKVARVSLDSGAVDTSLSTDIDGGAVWGVAVAPDGSKIYLAGYHDAVDGNTAGADYAVLDAATGRFIPSLSVHPNNSGTVSRRYGQDVVAVNGLVFWGGSEHVLRVYRASDGALLHSHSADRGGDFQDLEVVGDRVYGTCHCYTNHFADYDYWVTRNSNPVGVLKTPIKYVAAYSALTGDYINGFLLDASATSAGVWAVHGGTDGCLWVGGDLSRVTALDGRDRAAGGFAKFCDQDAVDATAPNQPGNLAQTRAENRKIVIRFEAATDNRGVTAYEVSRDGQVIASVAATTARRYWYTDSGLTAATNYTYTVVALDAAGNRSTPATLLAGTLGAPVPPVIST